MLMGNASKVLQNVAATIDTQVMEPLLQGLYDMVMVTDRDGLLRGDESIEVRGVSVAAERETERMRRLEFLQITANPIDMEITGLKGRAAVLRNVAQSLGMAGDEIVPPDEQIEATMKARQQVLQQQDPSGQTAPGQTAPGPAPGKPAATETQNMTRGPSGKVA